MFVVCVCIHLSVYLSFFSSFLFSSLSLSSPSLSLYIYIYNKTIQSYMGWGWFNLQNPGVLEVWKLMSLKLRKFPYIYIYIYIIEKLNKPSFGCYKFISADTSINETSFIRSPLYNGTLLNDDYMMKLVSFIDSDRLFRCVTTLRCGQTRRIKTHLTLRKTWYLTAQPFRRPTSGRKINAFWY